MKLLNACKRATLARCATRTCAVALLTLSPAAAWAKGGHSLAESMTFVRDQVASEGRMTYVVTTHDSATGQDWSNTMTGEASRVTVSGCSLSFHWATSVDGGTKQDFDQTVDFADGRKVAFVNREQELRSQVTEGGHPTWVSTVSPPLWVVTVTLAGTSSVLDFTNEQRAERVTHAIDHIMDLCGAKKEDF